MKTETFLPKLPISIHLSTSERFLVPDRRYSIEVTNLHAKLDIVTGDIDTLIAYGFQVGEDGVVLAKRHSVKNPAVPESILSALREAWISGFTEIAGCSPKRARARARGRRNYARHREQYAAASQARSQRRPTDGPTPATRAKRRLSYAEENPLNALLNYLPCSVCGHLYRLRADGMLRLHKRDDGGRCSGSAKPPAEERGDETGGLKDPTEGETA